MYGGTEEAELNIFGSQGKAEVWKQIFGSPGRGRDEMRKWTYPYLKVLAEQVWKMNEIFRYLAEWKYGKRNFRSLAVKAEQKCGSATSHLWKSRQRWNVEVDLPILGSPGRTSVEDERDLSKSSPSGSTESGTSYLWQSRQSRSAEAELHTFGSLGRDELQKWTYPYLEVLVEQVQRKNEIFRRPGRAEVRTAELLTFGSKDWAELRKRSFRPLKVLAEQSWCAEAELHIVGSQGRTEVRKRNFTSYEELAEQKCGTDIMSHHW